MNPIPALMLKFIPRKYNASTTADGSQRYSGEYNQCFRYISECKIKQKEYEQQCHGNGEAKSFLRFL
jgi:hypothetical protein